MLHRFMACWAALGAATALVAGPSVSGVIESALADPNRPADQTRLDPARKPARMIAFAGVAPGDRVGEFMPGNAYFTRILSKVVGVRGTVYAFIPEEELKNCDLSEVAGSRAIERDPAYRNVVHLSGSVNRFAAPEKLDVIWTAQNYHDLHDRFLGPADITRVNQNFFQALKPGGVLLIIDHAATPDSGLRDTESLHRIDPVRVRQEVEAAGFVFQGHIDDLSNAADDHLRAVFDPVVRGHTDQFVYKFKKPGVARGPGKH